MVYAHEIPTRRPGTDGGSVPPSLGFFVQTLVHTWVAVAFGGAACGVLAFNYLSVLGGPATAAMGFMLAAIGGIPLIVALALWLTFHRPGHDPAPLVRTLGVIGASIALAINGATNLWFLDGVVSTSSTWRGGAPPQTLMAVGGLACVAASGFVGWICGATLAQRHLDAIGHPAAPARRAARRRHPWR